MDLFQLQCGNGDGSVFHTGITNLDEIICGLHKQELTIIGARPGVGKKTKVIVEIEEVWGEEDDNAMTSTPTHWARKPLKTMGWVDSKNTQAVFRKGVGILK